MTQPWQRVKAPDFAGKLIAWLPAEMAALGWTVTVADELTTAQSVAVFRTGGPMRDMVTDSPTIVVECKGRTKTESMNMSLDARSLMHALAGRTVGGVAVQRVQEFSGPGHLPVDGAETRTTQTFSLDVSADVIG